MLHVSDLMREMKCDCFCWNSVHNSIHQESFYKMDCPFSNLWQTYLNATNCGLGHSMDSNEQSLKLLEENDVVCFARFEYKECRTNSISKKSREWIYGCISTFKCISKRE